MKTRFSFVSNSSSSSFLLPHRVDGVDCIELPEDIWKRIEENFVDYDDKRPDMSSVSKRWYLTTMINDCRPCYCDVADTKGVIQYLDGSEDGPYGWYDSDGEDRYVVFKNGGEEYFVNASDLAGKSKEDIPSVLELSRNAKSILDTRSLDSKQKVLALKSLFGFLKK